MVNWKTCKICGQMNGNSVTKCKGCGNDKFWPLTDKNMILGVDIVPKNKECN